MAPPSPPSPRRPLPQPLENTRKTQRHFLPEPVETTARSNRASPSNKEPLVEGGGRPCSPRKFLPQPVETSVKSSKKTPIVTVTATTTTTTTTTTRKFSPQLIETTKRTRKSGDSLAAVLAADKTDVSPGDQTDLPRQLRTRPGILPIPPDNSPVVSTDAVPRVPESRFTSSKLSQRVPRRRSFRVPDLPSIQSQTDSEESNESNCPSLATSPSPDSGEAELDKHATRLRESCDDKSSGYLLSLAARAAETQLREQAMAAYPNEQTHEPVDHFAFDRDSEESDEGEGVGMLSRDATIEADEGANQELWKHWKESAGGWGMAEMRKHQEKLEKERKDRRNTKEPELDRRRSVKGPNPGINTKDHQPGTDASGAPKNIIGGWQKGVGMAPMRNAASPPMAGEHLVFPKCQSPRQTRLDVTQYPCQQKAPGRAGPENTTGLWTPNGGGSRKGSASGLWMGVCAASVQTALAPPIPLQTGLLTPTVERDDPFSTVPSSGKQRLPPSPPSSLETGKTICIDNILSKAEEIDREFNDTFVTQIYNYLSFGYPAMARKYDTEISKVTKTPLEDLRRDDKHTNAKGYVGAPEGDGVEMSGVQDGQCARWMALRLYVKEWARQQPDWSEPSAGANNDWGARARKGSWAI